MFEKLDHLLADERFRFALIVLLALVVIFSKLGGTGLATWDDCFYADKAKELRQTGSFMTMHYAGEPAFENPPFFIWLVALSFSVWGTNEYAAIFPSALFGVLSIACVYLFARRLFGPRSAFFASTVLATTFYFTKYARHAMIDVTLSFFVMAAMLALVLALRGEKRYYLLWGLSIAVCILLKSVLGFFPLVISVGFLLVTRQWRAMLGKWFLAGLVLALGLGCSWYVHQYLSFGEAFRDIHFGWLILERGFRLEPEPWHAHLSYLEDLLRYYWPWLPVFAWSLYRCVRLALRKDENALLLLCWVVAYVGVMSMTQSRMFWYVMPIFPAAAMMCGETVNGWMTDARAAAMTRAVAVLTVALALVFNFTPLQLSTERERDIRIIAPYVKELAGSGARVVGFRYTYHALNNPLLFYSDHAARPIYERHADLAKQFADSQAVLCVTHAQEMDSVLALIPAAYVLRRTDGACLISNKAFDVSHVRTW